MDVDGTGVLTKENLTQVLNYNLGISATDEFIQTMLEVADCDGDGVVDIEDFTEFMNKEMNLET